MKRRQQNLRWIISKYRINWKCLTTHSSRIKRQSRISKQVIFWYLSMLANYFSCVLVEIIVYWTLFLLLMVLWNLNSGSQFPVGATLGPNWVDMYKKRLRNNFDFAIRCKLECKGPSAKDWCWFMQLNICIRITQGKLVSESIVIILFLT